MPPIATAVVAGQIAVEEVLHEELLTDTPVDTKVLGENDAAIIRATVVHPPGCGELVHRRVDDRVAGSTGSPRVDDARVVFPGHLVERLPE